MRTSPRWLLPLTMTAALAACDEATAPTPDAASDVDADAVADAGDASDASGGDAAPDATTDAVADLGNDASTDATDATDGSADGGGPELPGWWTPEESLGLVDVFVGTGGLGFGYAGLTPAAQLPNGFVKVGPDTTNGGSHLPTSHFSGYHHDDPDLRGFSHIRLVGTGAADLANLRVLPVASLDGLRPGRAWVPLDKASERGGPGWYEVRSGGDQPVLTELVAGWFSAFHRYAFGPEGGFLLFDVTSSVDDRGAQDSYVTVASDGFEGWLRHRGGFAGRGGAFTIYFAATVSAEADVAHVWDADGFAPEATEGSGTEVGAVLGWTAPSGPVELRVGLSLVDAAAARANLERDEALTFDEAKQRASDEWSDVLSRVRVRGGTERDRAVFYTAMYNAHRMPSRLDEPDGRYRGVDEEVHTVAVGRRYLNDLSLWDTFRTLHPWYELVFPELQVDCLWSLLQMYEQDGHVPQWPSMMGDTGSMLGSSANMLFAGSMAKGLEGIDWAEAFEALWDSDYGGLEDGGRTRDRVADYVALGYMPSDDMDESVSHTLEYAWADDALYRMAVALEDDRAEVLEKRAMSFSRTFEGELAAFWPRRRDGTFEEPGRLDRVFMGNGPYTEGSALHWRFYAFQRPDELVELFGGAEALGEALEAFFAGSALGEGEGAIDTLIPDTHYWHGNEVDLHASFLFDSAGLPERRWQWVRAIQDRLYSLEPSGLPGNDDGGTLSTWFTFTALGLYPVAGTDRYVLGAPRFEEAEVMLPGGATFRMRAEGVTLDGTTYRAAELDGVGVGAAGITHAELAGAELVFVAPE